MTFVGVEDPGVTSQVMQTLEALRAAGEGLRGFLLCHFTCATSTGSQPSAVGQCIFGSSAGGIMMAEPPRLASAR